MGMTIDEALTALGKERKYALHENKQAFDIATDTMRKYQKLQTDYENRLKADMVAMLTELQLEIEEESWTRECLDGSDETIVDMKSVNEVFQQKINDLKAENKMN